MNATRTIVARKMHGTENTFVLVDERPPVAEPYDALAQRVSAPDGGFGGADGLLVVRETLGDALAEMRIFNADGSEAQMCGNGVRCVARYLHERGAGDAFRIATQAGPIAATVVTHDPFAVRVDVGWVAFPRGTAPLELTVAGRPWPYYEVSLGNRHAVTFVDDPNAIDLEPLGVAFERHVPGGTNLHVVRCIDDSTLHVRHFERGVGMTQACGTGAVASAAAAIVARGVHAPVTVRVPGGLLRVDWTPGNTARLTGPAETLFERPLDL